MVILLGTLGSVLATGLPLMTVLFDIGTGVSLVGFAANLVDMPRPVTRTGRRSSLPIGAGREWTGIRGR